jgi:hypothetical protein
MRNTKNNNNFYYESKIGFLFPFKGTIITFFVIYALLVLFFTFINGEITKVSFLIPLFIILSVFSIVILFFVLLFIWNALFSPYKITIAENILTCRFFLRSLFQTDINDILYIKRHTGHSKYNGTYYKDKYTIVLKNRKKILINCFIFKNNSDLNHLFSNITKTYNKKYTGYLKNNKNNFQNKYHNNKYNFYIIRNELMILLDIILFFLSIFLVIHKIFLPALFTFAVFVAIPAVPVRLIMNIEEKNIIFKSAFGIIIHKYLHSSIKEIVIKNTFNITVTPVYSENRKKISSFSLSSYKSKDRRKIFEILYIIFENKISYNLDGNEPLVLPEKEKQTT